MKFFVTLLVYSWLGVLALARPAKPNIVWVLTDDQDQVLGGSFPPALGEEATPMPKTKRLMQDQGIHARNWYIHTPICSPSRSELLTGRYFHNIKQVGGTGYCSGMHVNYTFVNNNTFVRILNEQAGYNTGMFGKYLNEMPTTVPPGWDAWLANGGGDYIAPAFQTKNIDGLPDGSVHFTNDPANYSTALIGNISIAWIKKVAKSSKPFFAYIAPKAAHEPFNPAPWYRDHWDPSWPAHEPVTENWNCSVNSRKGKHGNVAAEPMITINASRVITGVFKNRWRTLMSVDDVISEVIATVEELGLLNTTYFLYSSDHGYQLGQFNIPMDKRLVYEWDTKIHLLARGPGITAGSSFSALGTQVDIAPTLLGLAGVSAPTTMDGKSIVPFLMQPGAGDILESTLKHLNSLGDLVTLRGTWRKEVFIEAYFCSFNTKCMKGDGKGQYPQADSWCTNLAENTDCWTSPPGASTDSNCYVTEDQTNNFIAVRRIDEDQNILYAEFQTGDQSEENIDFSHPDFVEYYDLDQDPWEMNNQAPTLPPKIAEHLHTNVQKWYRCSGQSCDPSQWENPFVNTIDVSPPSLVI